MPIRFYKTVLSTALVLAPLTAAAQAPVAAPKTDTPEAIYAVSMALQGETTPSIWKIFSCSTPPSRALAAPLVSAIAGGPPMQAVAGVPPAPGVAQDQTWCATPVALEALEWIQKVLEMYPTSGREE